MFKGKTNNGSWKFYLVFELPGDSENLVLLLQKIYPEYSPEQIREAIEKRIVSPAKVKDRLLNYLKQV